MILSKDVIIGKIRKEAEEFLVNHPKSMPTWHPSASLSDLRNLVHELQVHQIELEMQIAESQRATEEAESARIRFEALFEFAPVGYLTLNEGRKISGANRAMVSLLGRERTALLQCPLTDFIAPESQDAFYQLLRHSPADGTRQRAVLQFLRPNNQPVKCMLECIHLAPAPTPDNAYFLSATDMATAMKTQELISEAVHELKTPLTVILGWSDLLFTTKQRGGNIDAVCNLEDLQGLLKHAQRLNALIEEFLDAGRMESGKLELDRQPVDIREVITKAWQAVEYIAKQKEMTIKMDIGPAAKVDIDRSRMEQALVNLLSNAVKYSPDHKHITITARVLHEEKNEMLSIQVRDEGFGFTSEELATAGTPFGKARTRQVQKQAIKGTGLGLFIASQIIEQHGGTLAIRSAGVNTGTEVEIKLPMGE